MSDCPLCGSADRSPKHSEDGYRYVCCSDCGLVRQDPLPTAEEQAGRHAAYLPAGEEGRRFDLMSREVWARARARLVRRHGAGRVLDVGCGNGAFLASMRAAGWEVLGLEVCERGVARAASRGVRALARPLSEADLEPASFDAVTAFYVIEHLVDPLAFLGECRRVLRPGGTLYLRFPDTTPLKDLLGRLGIRNGLYHAPFHALDFPPRAMRRALERAGFTGVRIEVGGFTLPVKTADRAAGALPAALADLVDLATAGRVLLPGASKTAVAVRPA